MNGGESVKCGDTSFIMSGGMLESDQFGDEICSFLGKLFHNGLCLIWQQGGFFSEEAEELDFNALSNIFN